MPERKRFFSVDPFPKHEHEELSPAATSSWSWFHQVHHHLHTSMKKKTRLGAILSNWSSIAKWEYKFSTLTSQVRQSKYQAGTFWHFFPEFIGAETTHCWGWVNLGEQKDDICNILQTPVGHEEEDQAWVWGKIIWFWNFNWKISMGYYHKLSRGHQHFSDTTLRELCIQASWQMEIPKNKKKLVDRSENKASTDLGILCIFWPEVLVKIADDVGSDLERAEEHEEETEQDVQAADHQALAHLSINWSPFSSIWKQIMKKIISPSADICKLAAWGFKSRCTQLWCYLQLFKG